MQPQIAIGRTTQRFAIRPAIQLCHGVSSPLSAVHRLDSNGRFAQWFFSNLVHCIRPHELIGHFD